MGWCVGPVIAAGATIADQFDGDRLGGVEGRGSIWPYMVDCLVKYRICVFGIQMDTYGRAAQALGTARAHFRKFIRQRRPSVSVCACIEQPEPSQRSCTRFRTTREDACRQPRPEPKEIMPRFNCRAVPA